MGFSNSVTGNALHDPSVCHPFFCGYFRRQ